MLLSDRFQRGRARKEIVSGHSKKSISFNKFIKRADKKLDTDPQYDLVADFDFYDINCDYCLENYSRVSNLYIVPTDELRRAEARGEMIQADAYMLVKCPYCQQTQRVSDIRRLTAGSTIPTVESLGQSLHFGSADQNRNLSDIDMFPSEVRDRYHELMNMKNDPYANKKYIKELENYIKDFAGTIKQFKGKPFENSYNSLITKGYKITSIEDQHY